YWVVPALALERSETRELRSGLDKRLTDGLDVVDHRKNLSARGVRLSHRRACRASSGHHDRPRTDGSGPHTPLPAGYPGAGGWLRECRLRFRHGRPQKSLLRYRISPPAWD